MPELPDVEIYRQHLGATALRQRIAQTQVESPKLLADTTPQGLGRALKDRIFESSHATANICLSRWTKVAGWCCTLA